MVIQLATNVVNGYEGPLSRSLAILIANRLLTVGLLNATHLELREEDGELVAEDERLVLTRRLNDIELMTLASGVQAKHWVLGWLALDEEAHEVTLELELASSEADGDVIARVWRREFKGEMDELSAVLNDAVAALIEEIEGELAEEDRQALSVETRSFEAFKHFCCALDADRAGEVRHHLESARYEDPLFVNVLGDLALDALMMEERPRFEEMVGEMLHATHLRPDKLVEQVSKLEMSGYHEEGLEVLKLASGLAPRSPALQLAMARIALYLGPDASFDVLQELVEQGAHESEDVALLANMSALYRKFGDEERADLLSNRIVNMSANEESVDGHYELGLAAMEAGEFVLACNYLERVLEEEPELLAVRGDLAGAYIQLGRFEDAVGLLQGHEGESIMADSNLALALRHQGELKQAEAVIRAALDQDPGHPQAWAVLGDLRRVQGDYEDAQSAFEAAVMVEPENVFWHRELGRVLFHLGDYGRATEHFSVVIERQPGLSRVTPEILFVMAETAEREQGEEAAKALLQSALELEPKLWQALNNLAVLLMREGNYVDAEQLLLSALEVVPENEGVLMNLHRAGRRGN